VPIASATNRTGRSLPDFSKELPDAIAGRRDLHVQQTYSPTLNRNITETRNDAASGNGDTWCHARLIRHLLSRLPPRIHGLRSLYLRRIAPVSAATCRAIVTRLTEASPKITVTTQTRRVEVSLVAA
jgi:hypothetical protein